MVLSGWDHRKLITIQGGQVPGDLVDFPVYVDLSSDADVTGAANPDLSDIRFTADDGTTLLDFETIGASRVVAEGAWCWFSDPRAVYYNGKTYACWIDRRGDIVVAEYVHATETWSEPFILHTGLQYDDHNNPSILIRDSDQRLLVFYCGHNNPEYYMRISTNPEDATAFDAEVDLYPSLGGVGDYSYAIPVQLTGELNDPIYLFTRSLIAGNYNWVFSVSTDDGATWAAHTLLWGNAGVQLYLKVAQNGDARMDFVASDQLPPTANTSFYHFYYTGGAWFTSAGANMGAAPFNTGDPTLVYDGTAISGWFYDIAVDGSGDPVIACVTFNDPATDHRYQVTRWTGAAWASDPVCTSGAPLAASNYYSGGLCLDHADTDTVYVSRETGGIHEIEKYTYSGGAWSQSEILTSGSHYPNYRPFVPLDAAADLPVLWVAGDYPGYSAYKTSIARSSVMGAVARFFVRVPALSSTVDTGIYVYYGNSGAEYAGDPYAVWDAAGYNLVLHGTKGPSVVFLDSMELYPGVPTAGITEVNGNVYKAIQSDGDSAHSVQFGRLDTSGWSAITIETWAYYNSLGVPEHTLISNFNPNDGSFLLRLEPSNDSVEAMLMSAGDVLVGGSFLDITVPASTWKWVVMRYGNPGGMEAAADNSWSATTYGWTGNFDGDTPVSLQVCNSQHAADPLNGRVEMVRVSDECKTDNWLTARFNNESSPATFYTVGAEEPSILVEWRTYTPAAETAQYTPAW